MKVSVSDAKAQIADLVKRAEAGEEVILTRFGRPVVRLTPIAMPVSGSTKQAVIEEVQRSVRAKGITGVDAARSQDFLYGDDGLPV